MKLDTAIHKQTVFIDGNEKSTFKDTDYDLDLDIDVLTIFSKKTGETVCVNRADLRYWKIKIKTSNKK